MFFRRIRSLCGCLRFVSQYSTRYRPELDLVLKDLNIKIVSESLDGPCLVISDWLYVETQRKDWYRWKDRVGQIDSEWPRSESCASFPLSNDIFQDTTLSDTTLSDATLVHRLSVVPLSAPFRSFGTSQRR